MDDDTHPGRGAALRTVLRQVATAERAPSRAAVAAATGLTRATVSTQVDRLLEARLVREVGSVPRAGAGRPAAGLRLSGARIAGLGVEIGVDYLAARVLDLAGVVRAEEVVAGDLRGRPPRVVVDASAELAHRLLRRVDADGLEVVGAGWAAPGLIDAATGRVRLAPNLGWSEVDVVARLVRHPRLAALVPTLDNEASFAALAELGHPVPGGPEDLLVVSAEVGIGAGVISDGRVVRGRHGWSGELGHVGVDPRGPRCACGARGCLEVFAGQEAILAAAEHPVRASSSLGAGGGLDVLLRAARAAEPATIAALEVAGRALGMALASAVNLLDIDAVVLGGIYAPLARWLVPGVEHELRARVLRARLRPVPVRLAAAGPAAGATGAAVQVLGAVLDRPNGPLGVASDTGPAAARVRR